MGEGACLHTAQGVTQTQASAGQSLANHMTSAQNPQTVTEMGDKEALAADSSCPRRIPEQRATHLKLVDTPNARLPSAARLTNWAVIVI